MLRLPRLGIGTIQPGLEVQPAVWAVLELLRRDGVNVQHFCSRACFGRLSGERTITGQGSRHLDSWIMSADLCREVFAHSARKSDLSVVEGQCTHSALRSCAQPVAGGCWKTLCRWLDLPAIIVLDATRLRDCSIPPRPPLADGLLLDGIDGETDFCRWQTTLEALWGVPVLGALPRLPRLRDEIAGLPCGSAPSPEALAALADGLGPRLRQGSLLRLAAQREFVEAPRSLFRVSEPRSPITVAVAYDDCFGGYFPDVLDVLEMSGARLVEFSPLKHEALPPDVDVAYLGCGHPERYATALAENHCMTAALRDHARAGKRIYAEGGGLAYLCLQLVTDECEWMPMAGVLSAVAIRRQGPVELAPSEVTLAADTWLGARGERLRGYINSAWDLRPVDADRGIVNLASGADGDYALASRGRTIASRLHLNFAAQPSFLRGFLQPDVRQPLASAAVP